jgi:hypothetical protein
VVLHVRDDLAGPALHLAGIAVLLIFLSDAGGQVGIQGLAEFFSELALIHILNTMVHSVGPVKVKVAALVEHPDFSKHRCDRLLVKI